MSPSTPHVIALTPNPAVDLTITVDTLQDEATHRIDSAQRRFGGKGVNVATVAADNNYPAVMLGPVNAPSLAAVAAHGGTDFPPAATTALTDTPVPLRETWAIHRTGDNATVIINERGSRHPDEVWNSVRDTLAEQVHAHPGSVVTISGSWPPGTDTTTLDCLLTTAREGGAAAIIVDCAGNNLLAACRAGAIVKPNAAEIEETTGCADPLKGARQLIEAGASLVVVSLGEKGLIATDGARTLAARLPEPIVGNPTGAGDSLVAALATGLIDGLELNDLIIRGVAWSAAAVLVPYAGAIDSSWPQLAETVLVEDLTST